MQFTNAGERFFAPLIVPCQTCGVQLPPQLLLLVERDSVSPPSLDGRAVCLWFGELVAFMRDRTLDEGNDFSKALSGQMGGDGGSVKGNIVRAVRKQGIAQLPEDRHREAQLRNLLGLLADQPRMIEQSQHQYGLALGEPLLARRCEPALVVGW